MNEVEINNQYSRSDQCNFWKGITLTDSAVKQIIKLMHEESNALGLQITIKKSGCAGFSYKLNKVIIPPEKNIMTYERNGARIFIPIEVMPFIDGTELDYVQDELNYSFKFNNPQVQYSCGCGESFNI